MLGLLGLLRLGLCASISSFYSIIFETFTANFPLLFIFSLNYFLLSSYSRVQVLAPKVDTSFCLFWEKLFPISSSIYFLFPELVIEKYWAVVVDIDLPESLIFPLLSLRASFSVSVRQDPKQPTFFCSFFNLEINVLLEMVFLISQTHDSFLSFSKLTSILLSLLRNPFTSWWLYD